MDYGMCAWQMAVDKLLTVEMILIVIGPDVHAGFPPPPRRGCARGRGREGSAGRRVWRGLTGEEKEEEVGGKGDKTYVCTWRGRGGGGEKKHPVPPGPADVWRWGVRGGVRKVERWEPSVDTCAYYSKSTDLRVSQVALSVQGVLISPPLGENPSCEKLKILSESYYLKETTRQTF